MHHAPARGLYGTVVTQQLVGHRVIHRFVGAYKRQLVGVSEQGVGAVADQVHRGLVAGHEQQVGHGQQFFRIHAVAVGLHPHEVAE